ATLKGARRAGTAARVGTQFFVGLRYLWDQIPGAFHVGVENAGTTGAPLGHLIRRELVNRHPLVAREHVSSPLHHANFLAQRAVRLSRGLGDDGPVLLGERLPGLFVDDHHELERGMLRSRDGIGYRPQPMRIDTHYASHDHVERAVLQAVLHLGSGDHQWCPATMLGKIGHRLAENANLLVVDAAWHHRLFASREENCGAVWLPPEHADLGRIENGVVDEHSQLAFWLRGRANERPEIEEKWQLDHVDGRGPVRKLIERGNAHLDLAGRNRVDDTLVNIELTAVENLDGNRVFSALLDLALELLQVCANVAGDRRLQRDPEFDGLGVDEARRQRESRQ